MFQTWYVCSEEPVVHSLLRNTKKLHDNTDWDIVGDTEPPQTNTQVLYVSRFIEPRNFLAVSNHLSSSPHSSTNADRFCLGLTSGVAFFFSGRTVGSGTSSSALIYFYIFIISSKSSFFFYSKNFYFSFSFSSI